MRPTLRVVKVGGSLLDWPELPDALRNWLAAQSAGLNILLAGTGQLGDVIRQWDRAWSLGEEKAHWLCVDALSITSQLLANILPQAAWTNLYQELQSSIHQLARADFVFDPADFLKNHEPKLGGHRLPHNWSVTTDSISARLAEAVCADELVLLKSTTNQTSDPKAMAAAGIVDSYFPTAAVPLARVHLVNLRSTSPTNDK